MKTGAMPASTVNTRAKPARNAQMHLVEAERDNTPNAGFTADFQDLFNLELEQVIELEKETLATAVRLHSYVLDLYRNAFWFAPLFGNLFDAGVRAIASCMESPQGWFALLVPQAGRRVESGYEMHAQPSADQLAHCMDIAIGERFTASGSTVSSSGSTVASGSARRAQPAAEVPERSTDIAIGAGHR
jgi:hypothetical protein